MPVVVMLGGLALLSSALGRDPLAQKDAKTGPRPLLGVSMTLPRFPSIAPDAPTQEVSVQGQVLGIFDEADTHEAADADVLALVEPSDADMDAAAENALSVVPSPATDEADAWSPGERDVSLPKQPTTIVAVADWIRRPAALDAVPDEADEDSAAEPTWAMEDDDADVFALETEQLFVESSASNPNSGSEIDASTDPQSGPPAAAYAPAAPVGTRPVTAQPNASPLAGSAPYQSPAAPLTGAIPVHGIDTAHRPAPVQAASSTGPWPSHR